MEAVAGGSGGTKDPDEGKFTISENNASIMFVDPIGTEPLEDGSIPELSIYVPAGKTANIYVFEDMVLTNEKVDRSAIDIDPTATLNLWIKEGATVTVNSGFGKAGEVGNSLGAKGGPGGYAGIHVPRYDVATDVIVDYNDDRSPKTKHYEAGVATLNLTGGGTIISYGGVAGNGTDGSSIYGGGRRRWSRSRNRWKWWSWWKRK